MSDLVFPQGRVALFGPIGLRRPELSGRAYADLRRVYRAWDTHRLEFVRNLERYDRHGGLRYELSRCVFVSSVQSPLVTCGDTYPKLIACDEWAHDSWLTQYVRKQCGPNHWVLP